MNQNFRLFRVPRIIFFSLNGNPTPKSFHPPNTPHSYLLGLLIQQCRTNNSKFSVCSLSLGPSPFLSYVVTPNVPPWLLKAPFRSCLRLPKMISIRIGLYLHSFMIQTYSRTLGYPSTAVEMQFCWVTHRRISISVAQCGSPPLLFITFITWCRTV